MDDLADVRKSLQGIQKTYFCAPFSMNALQIGVNFAVAAEEQKLEAVVLMSQWLADPSNPSIHTRNTWLTDQIFSLMPNVSNVIVNPGFFADNYLAALEPIIDFGIMAMPFGNGLNAPPSAEDIAAVIFSIISNPSPHINKKYRPTGPKLLSPSDIAEIFGKVLNKKVRYQNVPVGMLNKVGKTLKLGKYEVEQLRWYMKEYQNNSFAYNAPTNVVLELTGKQPEDFETIVRRKLSADPNLVERGFMAKLSTGITLSKAMIMPGYNPDKYAALHEFPKLKQTALASNSEEWKETHKL